MAPVRALDSAEPAPLAAAHATPSGTSAAFALLLAHEEVVPERQRGSDHVRGSGSPHAGSGEAATSLGAPRSLPAREEHPGRQRAERTRASSEVDPSVQFTLAQVAWSAPRSGELTNPGVVSTSRERAGPAPSSARSEATAPTVAVAQERARATASAPTVAAAAPTSRSRGGSLEEEAPLGGGRGPRAVAASPPTEPEVQGTLDPLRGGERARADALQGAATTTPLLEAGLPADHSRAPTATRGSESDVVVARRAAASAAPPVPQAPREQAQRGDAAESSVPLVSAFGSLTSLSTGLASVAGLSPGAIEVAGSASFVVAEALLGPPMPISALGGVLRAVVQGGPRSVVVNLAPPELGRLRATVRETALGTFVQLQVERPETARLLEHVLSQGATAGGGGEGGQGRSDEAERAFGREPLAGPADAHSVARAPLRRGLRVDTWI